MLRHYSYSLVGAAFGWGTAALCMALDGPDVLPVLCCGLAIPLTLFVSCRLNGLALIVVGLTSLLGAIVISSSTSQYWLDRFMLLDSDPLAFFQPVTEGILGAFLASVLALFAFGEDLTEK